MTETMEHLLALQRLQFDGGSRKSAAQLEIETLRKNIPVPILMHYDHFALRGKKPVAIARNGVCGGCHLSIPVGKLAALVHTDRVHRCDTCGRYLYLSANEPVDLDASRSAPSSPAQRRSRKVG